MARRNLGKGVEPTLALACVVGMGEREVSQVLSKGDR